MTVENGQLMTQGTGQQKVPMFAESEAKFLCRVVPAEVKFVRDPVTHEVDRLVLYEGGDTVTDKRQ